VRAKILAQASLLKHYGLSDEHLRRLAAKVRSGDPDNLEAAAAIPYFSALFGPDFVRERDALGLNALLNYGYALLRAATARAIVGAGLHPALGVHHHNKYNPLCLADDAMEPLRPLADHMAIRLLREQPEIKDLTPNVKRRLAEVLASRVQLTDRSYPLLVGLERYGADLRRAICEGASLSPPRPLFDP
jgi:CRISPR-associated protein Cas1